MALSEPGSDPPAAFGAIRLHLRSASCTERALRWLSASAAIGTASGEKHRLPLQDRNRVNSGEHLVVNRESSHYSRAVYSHLAEGLFPCPGIP